MSQNNIYIAEAYEDFAYRIQLAEDLPKSERGYIFIGNTRAGKSTLALAMSGAQMKIIKGQGGLFYINPVDEEKYKGIVLNSQKSVTEKPNFYKPNQLIGNNFAIVDMPGHADSSRFREMINYHYIRMMANNLSHVRFLLVIVMPYKNGRYHLTENDIKMMDSFREMFPNLSNHQNAVHIIVNRAEKIGDGYADQIKRNLFQNFKNLKSKQMLAFYLALTLRNVSVIEAPTEARSQYPQITAQMRKIGDNVEASFIKMKTSDYYNINLFKDDPQSNQEFKKKLSNLYEDILKRIKKGIKQIEEIFLIFMNSVLKEGSYKEELINSITNFLDKFGVVTKEKEEVTIQPWKIDGLLPQARIISLIHSLTDQELRYDNKVIYAQQQTNKSLEYKQSYSQNTIKTLLNRLLSFVEVTQGKHNCYLSLKQFYLYMVRRVRQAFFLSSIIFNQIELSKKYNEQPLQFISGDVCQAIKQFNNFSDKFSNIFGKLIDKILSINLTALFNKYKNSQKKLFNELSQMLTTSRALNELVSQPQNRQQVNNKLTDLKDQVRMHYYLIAEPTHPNQQYNDFFQNLLRLYEGVSPVHKLKIVLKLAKISEQNNDIKTALALNLELNLNQEVMRLLAILEIKEQSQNIVMWYESIGDEFSKKGIFILAFKCYEIIKKYLFHDLEHFLRVENKIIALNSESQRLKLLIPNRLTVQKLFNWERINQEIKQLKHKHKIDNTTSSKAIFLKGKR